MPRAWQTVDVMSVPHGKEAARRTVGNYVLRRFKWNSALGLLSKAVLPLHDRHNTASI